MILNDVEEKNEQLLDILLNTEADTRRQSSAFSALWIGPQLIRFPGRQEQHMET